MFFLSLFLRIVNEDDSKCREQIVKVMSKIATKTYLSRQLIDSLFQM